MPFWLLTPFRRITRKLANTYIPKYFKRTINVKSKQRNKLLDKRVIVSLTSFPARLDNLWIVIQCLFRQTCPPDKIVLWLSQSEMASSTGVPESLQALVGDVFEIRVVEYAYRSHTKYYYALQEFSNDIVITVDDDLMYPPKTIERLVDGYIANPHSIIANITKTRQYDKDGFLKEYNSWPHTLERGCKTTLFFLGAGGVLYPPSSLSAEAFKPDIFMDICKLADDVWLNAMASINMMSVYHTPNKDIIIEISNPQAPGLVKQNVEQQLNDVQITNVRSYCINSKGIDPFSKD